MFHQLLESNAVRKPRVGGSLVSTVAHGALIAAALALTTQHEQAPPEPTERLYITPVVPQQPPSTAVHGSRATAIAAATSVLPTPLAILPVILDITIGIVSPDLTRSVSDAVDFGRRATSGTFGKGIGCARPTDDVSESAGCMAPTESGTWLAEQVDKPVVMMPGAATPNYPSMLRSAGISGAVLVEFVVDTLGRLEPGSSKVLQSDHDLFAASVRDVLPRLRFIPAEAGGHKVRQLVRLPFRFDLNRD